MSSQGSAPRWEMVSALSALAVGVAAIAVSAYTAYVQHKQAEAQVWPRLVFDWGGVLDDGEYYTSVANRGVGPARIRDVKMTFDGAPVHSWPELFVKLDPTKEWPMNWSTMSGIVLTPGEERKSLIIFRKGDPQSTRAAAIAKGAARVRISLCYCSIFDECWRTSGWLDDDSDTHEEPAPVKECPARGPDSFTQ